MGVFQASIITVCLLVNVIILEKKGAFWSRKTLKMALMRKVGNAGNC
jgi:hypothetical protein